MVGGDLNVAKVVYDGIPKTFMINSNTFSSYSLSVPTVIHNTPSTTKSDRITLVMDKPGWLHITGIRGAHPQGNAQFQYDVMLDNSSSQGAPINLHTQSEKTRTQLTAILNRWVDAGTHIISEQIITATGSNAVGYQQGWINVWIS